MPVKLNADISWPAPKAAYMDFRQPARNIPHVDAPPPALILPTGTINTQSLNFAHMASQPAHISTWQASFT